MESLHFSRHPLYLKYVSAAIFAQNQLEISLPNPPMQWLKLASMVSAHKADMFSLECRTLIQTAQDFFFFFLVCVLFLGGCGQYLKFVSGTLLGKHLK